jgi:hypothetical protein
MSYNPNIPQSTSKRAISQRQILINFQSIARAFANNHSALGLGTQGKHTVLILKSQGSDPATTISQIAIYQKLVGGIPNWFYRPSVNQTPIQMSYPSIDVTTANSQYTFAPGPFVIYTGKVTNPALNALVTLLPATTLRYVGLTVANYNGFNINAAVPTNITANTFRINFQNEIGPTRDVYYLAIGN